MTKEYYVLKLYAPRPTFSQDKSEAEFALLTQHVSYWKQLLESDTALIYGPIKDSDGAGGLVIFKAKDQTEAEMIIGKDPAVSALHFTYKLLPMPRAIVKD